MSESTEELNYLWSCLIVEELVRLGIKQYCLSPGSRCTPLAIAVADHEHVKSTVHYDERGTAYFALGHTRAAGDPAVLISTSGTAAANCLPAIVEAAMDCQPLLILTADRPPELRDTGANQTIDQVKIFGAYVRWHFDLPCPTWAIHPETILNIIDQAVYRAKRAPCGPVHLNCMFREPFLPLSLTSPEADALNSNLSSIFKRLSLFNDTNAAPSPSTKDQVPEEQETDKTRYLTSITRWLSNSAPHSRPLLSAVRASAKTYDEVISILRRASNGLIVIGKLSTCPERNAVENLIRKIDWPVFADVTSGLSLGHSPPNIIQYHDLLLMTAFAENFPLQVVIQFGGQLTSGKLLKFIKANQPEYHIFIKNHPSRGDPEHCGTIDIETDIKTFCDELAEQLKFRPGSPSLTIARRSSALIHDLLERLIIENSELTEPAVARLISKSIPEDTGLFLAASMPIRDMNMYADPSGAVVHAAANRGASGIDGTLATAAGFAQALEQPVTVLIGDLAFLHDLNSLALLAKLESKLIIVVINNDGGGIFSFLPIASFPSVFEKYFAAPHRLEFRRASEMFGLVYEAPDTTEKFIRAYKRALEQQLSTIIEIKTDRQKNFDFHGLIDDEIVANVNGFLKQSA